MKIVITLAAALVSLTACGTAAPNACQTAETYDDMFGTPSQPGPCWGRVILIIGVLGPGRADSSNLLL